MALHSIQMASKEPASTWLNTHEPVSKDINDNIININSRLESLAENGQPVLIGKVKAHDLARAYLQVIGVVPRVCLQQ